MRMVMNSKSVLVVGLVLVGLVGFCFVPSLGLARVEMSDGAGVVQGDPYDGLDSDSSEGDPTDGLALSVTQMMT